MALSRGGAALQADMPPLFGEEGFHGVASGLDSAMEKGANLRPLQQSIEVIAASIADR